MRPSVKRIVLVVMDGLRADAIDQIRLPALLHIASRGASTVGGRTVDPSVTAAAMTTLLTGVPPTRHGVTGQSFGLPPQLQQLCPFPRVLAAASLPTAAVIGVIPLHYRWLAGTLAASAGVETLRYAPNDADHVLTVAEPILARQREGLVFMHWADADRAGHRFGWHSEEYEDACMAIDIAAARLLRCLKLERDPSTLLVMCSDHGGGGMVDTDHGSDHPDDTTIPLLIHGGGAVPVELDPGVHLLDIPATILWALGQEIPESYAGRPLVEAFGRHAAAA